MDQKQKSRASTQARLRLMRDLQLTLYRFHTLSARMIRGFADSFKIKIFVRRASPALLWVP